MTITATPADAMRPRVLFVGDDASSPQIAASLLASLAGDRVEVHTARTQPAGPGGRSDEMLVAMGLNPADEQRLSVRSLHVADRVIGLGAGLDVARIPGAHYEDWDLGAGDLISRVQALSDDLTVVPDRHPVVQAMHRVSRVMKAALGR